MRVCKTCDNEVEGSDTICKDCKDKKSLAISVKDGTIKDKVSNEPKPIRRRDRVPNVRLFREVTLYAYQNSRFTFRYSTVPPQHTKVAWSKKMSGGDAHRFLTTLKNKNRLGKLESKSLPDPE